MTAREDLTRDARSFLAFSRKARRGARALAVVGAAVWGVAVASWGWQDVEARSTPAIGHVHVPPRVLVALMHPRDGGARTPPGGKR